MLLIRIYHDTDNSVDNVVANASYLMVITASLHSALISHDNYHISFAFWIAMTLPEYDQNPVVFVANLEEVKLEVLKLSIGMYRVLVLQPVLEKSGITILRQA